MKNKIKLRFLLVIPGILFFANHAHAGDLTLPLDIPTSVNSYFDHTSPEQGSDNSSTMTRYDGQQYTSSAANKSTCTLGAGCYNGHEGIDFETGTGDDVVAAAPGTVTHAGCGASCMTGYGIYVDIWHSSLGYLTRYGHLDSVNVSVNDTPDRGDKIGESGSTGNATGDHLHFSVLDAQTGGDNIDPYGWSGTGSDPWTPDQGYLWTTNPPSRAPSYVSQLVYDTQSNFNLGFDQYIGTGYSGDFGSISFKLKFTSTVPSSQTVSADIRCYSNSSKNGCSTDPAFYYDNDYHLLNSSNTVTIPAGNYTSEDPLILDVTFYFPDFTLNPSQYYVVDINSSVNHYVLGTSTDLSFNNPEYSFNGSGGWGNWGSMQEAYFVMVYFTP